MRLGRFDPENVAGKHKNVLLSDLIKDRLEAAQELKAYKMEILYLKWWLNELGDIPTEAVKFQNIQKALVELRKSRKPATSNRYFAALRSTFNLGLKNGRIERSPCVGIKAVSENNGSVRWLNTEEEEKLLAVLPLEYQLAVTVAIHTGLRQREQMSLKWSDINYTSNQITIRATKAGKVKYVPMNKIVVDAFRSLRSMPLDISQEVFYKINSSTPSGQYHKLHRMWERSWREAGIEKIRWHDLRHTFASRMVMAGVNILTVQKLLRHADVKMTMLYAHLAPAYLQEGVNALINWSELTPELTPTAEQSSH